MKSIKNALINKRVKIHCKDKKYFEADLLFCDIHMNLILDDTEEFYNEERRYLGLAVVKGDYVSEIEILSNKMNLN